MTTIVVVRKNGRATMAADTMVSHGWTSQRGDFIVDKSKIMQVGDTFIGLTGACAHEMVLRSYFAKQGKRARFNDAQTIFETWRRMHKALKNEYGLNASGERDDPYESSQINTLLMNKHGIFEICSLRSVTPYTRYWAIGSGWLPALGALHATYERFENPEDIARAAIEAAAEFDKGTALPLTSQTVALMDLSQRLPVRRRLRVVA